MEHKLEPKIALDSSGYSSFDLGEDFFDIPIKLPSPELKPQDPLERDTGAKVKKIHRQDWGTVKRRKGGLF